MEVDLQNKKNDKGCGEHRWQFLWPLINVMFSLSFSLTLFLSS